MLTFDPPVLLELDPRRVIGWRQLDGVVLAVRRGRVWVTHAHELQDHFVGAGERLELRPADRVVVEADGGPAQIALLPLPPRGAARWLAALRQRLVRRSEPCRLPPRLAARG